MCRLLIPTLIFASLALPAAAQDVGGLKLSPRTSKWPHGLAQVLQGAQTPFVTASDLQNAAKAKDRSTKHQQMIASVRGDSGFLGGFSFGNPLNASVQPPPKFQDDPGFVDGGSGNVFIDGSTFVDASSFNGGNGGQGGHGRRRPVIINNTFDGPVAVTAGNGNVVQLSTAQGSGPIAQQQVATVGGATHGGGATNLVTSAGNIVQSAPRH